MISNFFFFFFLFIYDVKEEEEKKREWRRRKMLWQQFFRGPFERGVLFYMMVSRGLLYGVFSLLLEEEEGRKKAFSCQCLVIFLLFFFPNIYMCIYTQVGCHDSDCKVLLLHSSRTGERRASGVFFLFFQISEEKTDDDWVMSRREVAGGKHY